ncbi:hypothetical protein AB6D20_027670 (plasmid) [Vibrio splendidus]
MISIDIDANYRELSTLATLCHYYAAVYYAAVTEIKWTEIKLIAANCSD